MLCSKTLRGLRCVFMPGSEAGIDTSSPAIATQQDLVHAGDPRESAGTCPAASGLPLLAVFVCQSHALWRWAGYPHDVHDVPQSVEHPPHVRRRRPLTLPRVLCLGGGLLDRSRSC